jgi:catechol 2,3-dioxygenase-like lactoylglutathione lyase family enzyme
MDETVKYPGYTHIALRVADINQAIQRIKMLGIVITEGPVTFGDGKTSIFFRDPDRNVIELTQHMPKSGAI